MSALDWAGAAVVAWPVLTAVLLVVLGLAVRSLLPPAHRVVWVCWLLGVAGLLLMVGLLAWAAW